MADKTTFIKLDRNIINWRWFTSPKILSVFIWLLVKANVKEGHFQKDTIKRGSLITSNAHIAEGCGITIQNARTALADLESTGEISREVRNHYQIITIVNYEAYQSSHNKNDIATNKQLTGNSQATNKQLTTIKEYKNNKNERKKEYNIAPLPFSIDDIVPEIDLDGYPDFEHMPCEADGTKRDIPPRVRKLFYGDYGAYYRYRERMNTECHTK